MFTGIIEAVGSVVSIEDRGADKIFSIETGKLDLSDVGEGDSICVNGVCLTVTGMSDSGFRMDVSAETLSCTTFAMLTAGARVNLEKSLKLSDRLSGHIVSGHVDGIGAIEEYHDDGRSVRFLISHPAALQRYFCNKGSVCVDGVSLTINDTNSRGFSVNIIPHTLEETIFSGYRPGTAVNLEIDIIARYLESLQRTDRPRIDDGRRPG